MFKLPPLNEVGKASPDRLLYSHSEVFHDRDEFPEADLKTKLISSPLPISRVWFEVAQVK